MKDFYFASDLLAAFRHDPHYGVAKHLVQALRKFGLPYDDRSASLEPMVRTLVVHIMEQRGDSEPFLTESFIEPQAVIQLLKDHKLPVPTALQPAPAKKQNTREPLDQAQFEKYFDMVCRNCGTVTDPLGTAYRTPIGRLIFRTYLEIRRNLGINPTGWYVFQRLKDFDRDKVITAIEDDYLTWRTEDGKEKLTSVDTISRFVLRLDREVARILGR